MTKTIENIKEIGKSGLKATKEGVLAGFEFVGEALLGSSYSNFVNKYFPDYNIKK